MLEGALTADHATFLLRRRGADSKLVSAALRLECEVTVLLDALDEMGYLVETQGVEQDVLRARSAERRERRRSGGRRQSFGPLESSSPGSRTKKPFVRTQVFEIEQRAAAAALERERETATAMPAMSTPSVGIAA